MLKKMLTYQRFNLSLLLWWQILTLIDNQEGCSKVHNIYFQSHSTVKNLRIAFKVKKANLKLQKYDE
jgi:hypothetical protein